MNPGRSRGRWGGRGLSCGLRVGSGPLAHWAPVPGVRGLGGCGARQGQAEASGDRGCGRRPGQVRVRRGRERGAGAVRRGPAGGPCGGPGCVRGLGPEPGREELPGALPAHGAPGLGQRGFNGPVGFCRRDSPKGLDREV